MKGHFTDAKTYSRRALIFIILGILIGLCTYGLSFSLYFTLRDNKTCSQYSYSPGSDSPKTNGFVQTTIFTTKPVVLKTPKPSSEVITPPRSKNQSSSPGNFLSSTTQVTDSIGNTGTTVGALLNIPMF